MELLKPAHGLVDFGRLWHLTIELFFQKTGLQSTSGFQQVFVERASDGGISLSVAKVVIGILLAGPRKKVEEFHLQSCKEFTVGRFTADEDLVLKEVTIHQEPDFRISVNMKESFESPLPTDIGRQSRKKHDHACNVNERTKFKHLTSSLNFLGHGVLRQAAFAATYLQQPASKLKLCDLVTANKVRHELRSRSSRFLYPAPVDIDDWTYLAFSDAKTGRSSYGQTDYLSETKLPCRGRSVYHAIDWHTGKQNRVSFSSIRAEILAAAISADRRALMAESIQCTHGEQDVLPFMLTVDSNGLYFPIKTKQEGSNYRLRPTVGRMKYSDKNGGINTMQ